MPRVHQDITQAELNVLQVLWDQGESTIRQITDVLYPRGGVSAYATVQKLLDRLEEKGGVARARAGNANVFAARLKRDELIGQRLRAMAEQLCGGSLTPLLTSLVRVKPLSERERKELRQLIDRHGEK
jgi:predicted transcriptional regulator